MNFVGNLLLFTAVKEFCKSMKKWQSYSHGYGGTLFWLTLYFVFFLVFFLLIIVLLLSFLLQRIKLNIFLVQRRTVWLTPTARVPCSNAANIEQRKTWTQSEFCTWQNSLRKARAPPLKNVYIYIVYQPGDGQTCATFGWRPLSDVGAATKPTRETRWNLLGWPKYANRSQPLIGRSSPYCENYRVQRGGVSLLISCWLTELFSD